MIPTYILIIALAVWNLLTFAMYGIDKQKAKNRQWRTSETTLIAAAFLMAAIGALLGMYIFRHKTKHIKFKILVPLGLIFNAAISIAYFWFVS